MSLVSQKHASCLTNVAISLTSGEVSVTLRAVSFRDDRVAWILYNRTLSYAPILRQAEPHSFASTKIIFVVSKRANMPHSPSTTHE